MQELIIKRKKKKKRNSLLLKITINYADVIRFLNGQYNIWN